MTVTKQSDLDVFSNCSTVTGSITIGDTTETAISIPSNVQVIEGTLDIENNTVASIEAEGLINITAGAEFVNLSSLTTLNMPALTFIGSPQAVYGLDFVDLPVLYNLSLPNLTEVGWLYIISINPSERFDVELPTLGICWAEAVFQGITSLDISSLTYTLGPLSFWNIQELDSLLAPSLTNVGGLLVGNSDGLTSLSFPSLAIINGSFNITNDLALLDIPSGFPLLNTVGSMNLTGPFTTVSLPSLNQVNGDVYIQSSSSEFVCPIPQLKSDVINHGYTFYCGSISSSGNADTGNTSNTAGGIVGGIFLLILVAIIYSCCCRRNSQGRTNEVHNTGPLEHVNRALDRVEGGVIRGFAWFISQM